MLMTSPVTAVLVTNRENLRERILPKPITLTNNQQAAFRVDVISVLKYFFCYGILEYFSPLTPVMI